MAYESPISVWWSDTKIEQLRDEYDNLIVRAVKNVCPNVDKDELIKALQYDRGQYEKGFADGIAFEPPVKTHGDAVRAMSDEELANQLAAVQYVGIRTFLLGFDKELLEDLDAEIKKAWSEVVQEKLVWLRQEADVVKKRQQKRIDDAFKEEGE